MPAMKSNLTNKPSDLIGQSGEFTGAVCGKTYQCVVTGTETPPWDEESLVITYIRDGQKIEGAMIPVESFRPDDPGNYDEAFPSFDETDDSPEEP